MGSEIIDISAAKERFMGNFKLFAKFLYQFPERSLFGDLEEQVKAGDAEKAFQTAHTMKGIAGNLSLKLIEKPLSEVVELLRSGKLPDAGAWNELAEAYTVTVEEINRLQADEVNLFA